MEVVVRGDGRGTRDLGDGSGTSRSGSSCSCPVDVRGPRGLRGSTVVVHGRRGSSRSRDVVEVVVHGDDSCTRFVDVRVDSSGTRFGEELDAHGVDGRGT